MKVKLLKKIRRRYSITRYDDLGTCDNDMLISCKNGFGLPFFLLADHSSDFYESSDDLEYLKARILSFVNQNYKNKVKKKPIKSTKVWHVT